MKKLLFLALLGTSLTTLSSFTTVTVNSPQEENETPGNETQRSKFHCIFATIGISFGDVVILEPAYPTWEACRAA